MASVFVDVAEIRLGSSCNTGTDELPAEKVAATVRVLVDAWVTRNSV